jgi:hypothetical protein
MRGGTTEVNETHNQKWATSKKMVEDHWSKQLKAININTTDRPTDSR